MGSGGTGGTPSAELLAVGQRLRAARELRHLSLESVEEATHIRRTYLQAIEEGRAFALPGEVFLKGFMRTYANHLGLDGAAIVEGYKQALSQSPAGAGEADETSATRPPERRVSSAQERIARLRRTRGRSRRRSSSRLGWWMGAIAVVAVAGWALAHGGHRAAVPVTTSAPPRSTAVQRSSGASSAATSRASGVSTSAATPSSPSVVVGFGHTATGWQGSYTVTGAGNLQVTISASYACWTRRWVDGASTYTDQTLAANGPETVTWTAAQSLKIQIGDAPGIASIRVDGQPTRALPVNRSNPEWLTFTLGPSAPGA